MCRSVAEGAFPPTTSLLDPSPATHPPSRFMRPNQTILGVLLCCPSGRSALRRPTTHIACHYLQTSTTQLTRNWVFRSFDNPFSCPSLPSLPSPSAHPFSQTTTGLCPTPMHLATRPLRPGFTQLPKDWVFPYVFNLPGSPINPHLPLGPSPPAHPATCPSD